MQTAKIKAYLGFAIKSRAIVYGVDNIEKNKPQLIIYSANLASAKRRLENHAQKTKATIIMLDDKAFNELTNNERIKALAVLSENLAKAIKDNL